MGQTSCSSEILENLDFRSGGPRGRCVLPQQGHRAAHRDKKSTGSFAACAAGGVGRKTGRRRWPYFNGQRRRDRLDAPKAADRWGLAFLLLSELRGEKLLSQRTADIGTKAY